MPLSDASLAINAASAAMSMNSGIDGGFGGLGDNDGVGGVGTIPQSSGSTITEEEVRLDNNNGDHERFSHYVRKEKIVESAVTGKAVKALCGKKWVPSRDPEKFPICPTCKEIYSKLPKE